MDQLFSLLSSWLPVTLWAGLIYYLSSIPGLNTGWGIWDFILRKTAHVVEFAVLTFLLLRAFVRSWPAMTKRTAMVISFLLALVYAVSDEVHQSFVPGRGPSVGDVVVDACGMALCLLVFRRETAQRWLGLNPL
jgi:VanZ family protein